VQFDFLSRKFVRPKLTESFPFNYMLKSKLPLSRHFEYTNEQITYHFWLCCTNYAPVWTISQTITAVPWTLKVPTQFQTLKCKRHSKALRRSEKMHPARFSRPKSTFLTIPILIAKKIPLWSLFLIVYLHLQWNAVLTQIMLCLTEAVLRNSRYFAWTLLNLY
jgi:hypothetical protein